MGYALTTTFGGTEAVIDDNCGVSKFYAIANTLVNNGHVKFLNQIDKSETLNWDFTYKNQLMTLHFNVFNGVSIFPQKVKNIKKENNAIMEVAQFLEQKVF